MNIDIKTSLIINVILTFLMTIYLFILWINYRKKIQGIGMFLIGNCIMNSFTTLLMMQGSGPAFLTVVLSNTIMMTGMMLVVLSFHRFTNYRMSKGLLTAIIITPLALFVEQIIFTYPVPNLTVRILSVNGVGLFANVVILMMLLRSLKQLHTPGIFFLASVIILILNNITRSVMTLAIHPGQKFLNLQMFQSIFVLVRTVSLSFWPFGFAMLILQQSNNSEKETSRQKTLLLQELYHRTKNNMNVIVSLINWQISKLPDADKSEAKHIRSILESTKNRIYSLSLVYKQLYKTKNLSRISIGTYLKELAENLQNSLLPPDRRITIQYELEDLVFSIETAGHLGLILNELITNSFKYAFPDSKEGKINLNLKHNFDGNFHFKYSDNGVGIKENITGSDRTIGMEMIKVLSEEQLQGAFGIQSDNGFHYNLEFKDNLYHERV